MDALERHYKAAFMQRWVEDGLMSSGGIFVIPFKPLGNRQSNGWIREVELMEGFYHCTLDTSTELFATLRALPYRWVKK